MKTPARIQIAIPSKNRESNLLLVLQALRTQTFKEWDLSIIDDNDNSELLRKSHNFNIMINRLWMEGHCVHIIRGVSKGPQFAHNILLSASHHELILRMDDDILPEPDFIEKLYSSIDGTDKNIAACAGVYPDARESNNEKCYMPATDDLELAGTDEFQTIQQKYLHAKPKSVEVKALYSTFLYKRSSLLAIGGFPIIYSPIGNSEETDTTYRLFKRGYKLVVDQSAIAWHFYVPSGGIKINDDSTRNKWFNSDVVKWEKRYKLLESDKFNFEDERKQNLDHFKKFEDLRENFNSGFYFY